MSGILAFFLKLGQDIIRNKKKICVKSRMLKKISSLGKKNSKEGQSNGRRKS